MINKIIASILFIPVLAVYFICRIIPNKKLAAGETGSHIPRRRFETPKNGNYKRLHKKNVLRRKKRKISGISRSLNHIKNKK